MSKRPLKHQPRPVLYDSGVMSRLLDDLLDPRLNDFAVAHEDILQSRDVFIGQTITFELQPVLRVLGNRYPDKATRLERALLKFNQIDLDARIGERAISLKRGLEQVTFADATIAATALVYGLDLFTMNEDDFNLIPGLRLYKPRNYDELLARLGAGKTRKLP